MDTYPTPLSSSATLPHSIGHEIESVEMSLDMLPGYTQLSIFFSDKMKSQIAKIDFNFVPLKRVTGENLTSFFNEISSKETYRVADLYPLNGTIKNEKFNISNYVRPVHRKEIEQHIHKFNSSDQAVDFVRLMVIDFKDSKKRYDNRDEIAKVEQAFTSFLINDPPKNNKTQAEIHALIRKNGEINFLINEGTLKADLLTRTFLNQNEFLQKDENSARFCQLCEIIMNGFKQGKEVVANGTLYHPQDYIRALNSPISADIKYTIPINPFLQTYYPRNYKTTYSNSSIYYTLINRVSKVGYHHDDQNITTITIQ